MKPGRFYHVSSLAYLPTLIGTAEFRSGAELNFRCEERIRKVLSKRGMLREDVEIALAGEMQHKDEYLLDAHRYFWLTPSLMYAFKKAGKERNRTVYLDTPFSQKYGGAHPIIYAFNGGVADQVLLYGEGRIRHRQFLRFLREKVFDVNFVTQDHISFSDVEFIMVDKCDEKTISDFLDNNGLPSSLVGVPGLIDGGNMKNTRRLETMLNAFDFSTQNLSLFEELGFSFEFF